MFFQSLLGCFANNNSTIANCVNTLSIPFGMLLRSGMLHTDFTILLSIPFGMLLSDTFAPTSLHCLLSIPFGMLLLSYRVISRVIPISFNPFWDASWLSKISYFNLVMMLSIPFGMLPRLRLALPVTSFLCFQSLLGCFIHFYFSESKIINVTFNPFWDASCFPFFLRLLYIYFQSLLGCFTCSSSGRWWRSYVLSIPFGMLHGQERLPWYIDFSFQSLLGCFHTSG